MLKSEQVKKYFTRSDGTYLFARWNRPIAPVAFGIEDQTVSTLKGAIEAVCQLAGHEVAETDPELGSNRFDPEGGIKACFAFILVDEIMQEIPADTICLGQAVQSMLLWSDEAFLNSSPLATTGNDMAILKPEVAAIIRAAYDPVMPRATKDDSHALRLAARLQSADEG